MLFHHEHWDGGGYPFGRRGNAIPLEARVLAVADAFDAMTSPRPYGPPLPVNEALAEIDRCAGTQFDPLSSPPSSSSSAAQALAALARRAGLSFSL